ncbi:MAG TPA: DUF951 domain-containing protein [bacterium]|nr:DUF951 domain-containing protein [bacterium]
MPVVKLALGDVVRTRKAHPCGGDQWEIVRLGADIGLRCLRCDRRVLMPRSKLERRIRAFVRRGPDAPAPRAPLPGTPGGAARVERPRPTKS